MKIEKNIPLPPRRERFNSKILSQMKFGDSVFFAKENCSSNMVGTLPKNVSSFVKSLQRKCYNVGGKWAIRAIYDNENNIKGYRCWFLKKNGEKND